MVYNHTAYLTPVKNYSLMVFQDNADRSIDRGMDQSVSLSVYRLIETWINPCLCLSIDFQTGARKNPSLCRSIDRSNDPQMMASVLKCAQPPASKPSPLDTHDLPPHSPLSATPHHAQHPSPFSHNPLPSAHPPNSALSASCTLFSWLR